MNREDLQLPLRVNLDQRPETAEECLTIGVVPKQEHRSHPSRGKGKRNGTQDLSGVPIICLRLGKVDSRSHVHDPVHGGKRKASRHGGKDIGKDGGKDDLDARQKVFRRIRDEKRLGIPLTKRLRGRPVERFECENFPLVPGSECFIVTITKGTIKDETFFNKEIKKLK